MRSLWLMTTVCLVCPLIVASPAIALDFWYDFEGDSGTVATDKLTLDGSQDGTLTNEVSFGTSNVPFGTQAAVFEAPSPMEGVPPFSTLEIPGSTQLGPSFTLAIHVDMEETDFTRLFSSYRGTGPVLEDRVIFDIDPSGATLQGFRAFVNNTGLQFPGVPEMLDPGYHHYAMTVDEGDVTVYFDGEEMGNDFVGTDYFNDENLHVGEDPHDGGGSADEQLIGHFDEVLVIDRALGADDIALLAGGNPVSSVVTPQDNEYAVYYNFEGDRGATVTDKFTADGAQDGIVHRDLAVDGDPASAKLGQQSARINHPNASFSPFSAIDVGPVGNLGDAFTMSAVINPAEPGVNSGALTRIFSTFGGTGSPAGRLIFDFDPTLQTSVDVRVILPDGTVVNETGAMVELDENQTLTAVYDQGDLRVYLNGTEIGDASTSGDVDLGGLPLRIGEDVDARGLVNENFVGTMDDVLFLSRALTPEEVEQLATDGAAALLGVTGPLLRAGDADQDFDFDQLDLVKVLAAGKYLTGQSATWGEGDWNGAPGGTQGDPPAGNGRFDQVDIIAALAGNTYLNGPYAAVASGGQQTFVPEPGSLLLLAVGVLSLMIRRRRLV